MVIGTALIHAGPLSVTATSKRTVFATCSLEPAEGEAQLTKFLAARADYSLVPVTQDELPAGIVPNPGGWVRTLPGMIDPGGNDGFFIARLRRQG